MRQALYFGSFNPLHIGHIAIANYILAFCNVDRFSFVLTPQNPLKAKETLSDEQERLHSLRESIKKSSLPINISDIEFSLPKPLYTLKTLREFKRREPEYEHILIIGADNIAIIESWNSYKELLEEFEVWVYPRAGYDTKKLCKKYGVKYLDAPIIEISSTMIREGESQGKDMSEFKY